MLARAKLSYLAKAVSAGVNLPRLFGSSPERSLTTLLFHHFFCPGESREAGRERLRRQLDWLRRSYASIDPKNLADRLTGSALPDFPLLVTIDDANIEYPQVEDIFRAFDVPVLMFVCVGWSDLVEPHESGAVLARIVALLQWGDSREEQLPVGRLPPIRLGEQYRDGRAAAIDQLIVAREEIAPELESLAERLQGSIFANRPKSTCSWSDLRDLARAGTTMGCHSISHVHLAQASDVRIAFEIGEARRIIFAKFGDCQHFAYPFGTPNSYDERTTAEIKRAGFDSAFLTHADFADDRTDRFHLPRLVIPDYGVSDSEFQAIVKGGGIVLDRVKRLITRARQPVRVP